MSVFGTPRSNPGNINYPVNSASATVNTALGDLIVVFLANMNGTMGANPTCTDSAGNVYTPLSPINSGGVPTGQWFYCLSATHASASNVVTCTPVNTGLMLAIRVWDFPCTGTATFDFVLPTSSATYLAVVGPPGFTYPNSATGTDELVLVVGTDSGRVTTWTGPAGSGFTLDPLITGNASYLNAMGSEYGIFANPNTTPSLVQHVFGVSGAQSGTFTIAMPSNVTAGNLVMIQFLGNSGTTFGAVSDTQSNRYHSNLPAGGTMQNWYALVTSSGALSISIATVTASTWFLVCAMEMTHTEGQDPTTSVGQGTTGNPNTITMLATKSPNMYVSTLDINGGPGHSVTFTQNTSTLVDQTGSSTFGFLALLQDLIPTTGTIPHPAVNTSAPADSVSMTGITWWSTATPFMDWTGPANQVTAIGFKGASAGPPGGGGAGEVSLGQGNQESAISLGLRRIRE